MKLNILLVDDSLTMRSMLRKIMLISGLPVAQFFEASNGREGLNILESQWIDLLMVDLNMPIMGGLEMIEHVRRKHELTDLPIIVISTESSQTRITEITSQTRTHFIHKPFTPEQVRGIVQQYWELSTSRLTEQMLIQVAQEVFESLTCLSLQHDRAAAPGEDADQYRSLVRFNGPFNGTLALDVPGRLLPVIFQNMLGETTPSTQEQQLDALGEMNNVICGNVLARIAGPEHVFNLDAPHNLRAGDSKIEAPPKSRRTTIRMTLDENWIELNLITESDAVSVPSEAKAPTQ